MLPGAPSPRVNQTQIPQLLVETLNQDTTQCRVVAYSEISSPLEWHVDCLILFTALNFYRVSHIYRQAAKRFSGDFNPRDNDALFFLSGLYGSRNRKAYP